MTQIITLWTNLVVKFVYLGPQKFQEISWSWLSVIETWVQIRYVQLEKIPYYVWYFKSYSNVKTEKTTDAQCAELCSSELYFNEYMSLQNSALGNWARCFVSGDTVINKSLVYVHSGLSALRLPTHHFPPNPLHESSTAMVSPPSGPSRETGGGSTQKLHRKMSDHITVARALRWNNKPPCPFPLSSVKAKTDQCLARTVLGFLDGHIVLLSVTFHGPARVTICMNTHPSIWRKENMGCLVVMFNWIHLGVLNPENSAPIYSSLKFEQLMIFCPFERQASLFHPRECFIGT